MAAGASGWSNVSDRELNETFVEDAQIAEQAEEIEDLRARLEALEKLVQGGE